MNPQNVASFVLQAAPKNDQQLAIALPTMEGSLDGPQCTFGELRKRIAQFQAGIQRAGLKPGDRVVMLFPLSIDFFALALALWASGQVLVFLDGRLDRKRFLRVLVAARAQAIISVRPLLKLWPLVPALWRIKRFVSDGTAWGTEPLGSLIADTTGPAQIVDPQSPDQSALLSFTSGSTGLPKGADRTHAILLAQHYALQSHAPDRQGEIDMPCFPAVVLHNLSCGISSVLPPIDLRRPGSADPARVAQAIERFQVASLSGAPAYMGLLTDHLRRSGIRLPSVRRIYVGGAPVSRQLAARILAAFPGATAEAVYGSTEAEPMAGVALRELADSSGEGYLIGRPSPVAELALVELPELAPPLGPEGLDRYRVADGASGEVLVRGPHVNQRYIGDEEANQRYKVADPDGSLWHRTGDLARRDDQGRLWLTGRVPDRVTHRGRVLLPFILEDVIATEVPGVHAAVLIAHAAAPEGELVLRCEAADADAVLGATRRVLAQRELTSLPVRRIAEIPTDARHNSKIDRPALRAQLAGKEESHGK